MFSVSETPDVFTVAFVAFTVHKKFVELISTENNALSSKEPCAIPLKDFNRIPNESLLSKKVLV